MTWPTAVLVFTALGAGLARAEIRVQDIARLQGQRTNKLMGYGLVVGLNGTGDGEKYSSTMRALMALHRRYHAPVLSEQELRGNSSVAIVTVEVTVPEYGAREGETLDVVVSRIGMKGGLAGGQLLTTPLQYALFDANDPATQQIFALAGGRIELPDKTVPTRGIIRGGATLEADFFYSFIENEHITLVLNESHAGWTWAQVMAGAINHAEGELAERRSSGDGPGRLVIATEVAEALGPKNVRVRIPAAELARPAGFISRVLQTELFMQPEPRACVVINKAKRKYACTGNVTISPTVLQISGFGSVSIGGGQESPVGVLGLDPQNTGGVRFQELKDALTALKATDEQMIEAIELLYKTGTLHAQLQYEE